MYVYMYMYYALFIVVLLQAMRVFFAIRKLFQSMRLEKEQHLPLTPSTTSVVTEDVIDTSMFNTCICTITNSCTVCVWDELFYLLQ